jgi:hypothetical protein
LEVRQENLRGQGALAAVEDFAGQMGGQFEAHMRHAAGIIGQGQDLGCLANVGGEKAMIEAAHGNLVEAPVLASQ